MTVIVRGFRPSGVVWVVGELRAPIIALALSVEGNLGALYFFWPAKPMLISMRCKMYRDRSLGTNLSERNEREMAFAGISDRSCHWLLRDGR